MIFARRDARTTTKAITPTNRRWTFFLFAATIFSPALQTLRPLHAADNPASPDSPNTGKPNTPIGEATGTTSATPTADASNETPEQTAPFKVGVDLYYGLSNVDGYRRYSDHMWAGYGPFVPSTAYVAYENPRGYSAKLSIGTGDLFNTGNDEFYQPAEAWLRAPLGKNAGLTVGKFWVPLALQEWEYESKPGAMLDWSKGDYTLSLAATRNQTTRTGNFYSRVAKNWGERASLGLSLAGGRGVTFASDHDRGIGLDGHYVRGDWEASVELLRFKRGSTGRFDFIWGKLAYHGWNKWTPFVARYNWSDQLGQQGNFHSSVLGLQRQINEQLAIETAYARPNGDNKYWLEVHYAWEKPFGRMR